MAHGSIFIEDIFIDLLESQRECLSELNEDHSIDEEIVRQQLYQIDLEEEHLKTRGYIPLERIKITQ